MTILVSNKKLDEILKSIAIDAIHTANANHCFRLVNFRHGAIATSVPQTSGNASTACSGLLHHRDLNDVRISLHFQFGNT